MREGGFAKSGCAGGWFWVLYCQRLGKSGLDWHSCFVEESG